MCSGWVFVGVASLMSLCVGSRAAATETEYAPCPRTALCIVAPAPSAEESEVQTARTRIGEFLRGEDLEPRIVTSDVGAMPLHGSDVVIVIGTLDAAWSPVIAAHVERRVRIDGGHFIAKTVRVNVDDPTKWLAALEEGDVTTALEAAQGAPAGGVVHVSTPGTERLFEDAGSIPLEPAPLSVDDSGSVLECIPGPPSISHLRVWVAARVPRSLKALQSVEPLVSLEVSGAVTIDDLLKSPEERGLPLLVQGGTLESGGWVPGSGFLLLVPTSAVEP